MTEIKRDSRGRFIKGNKEGARFGSHNGVTTDIDPIEAREKGQETKRRKRTERDVMEMIAGLPLPKDFKDIAATLARFGIEPSEMSIQAAVAVNLFRFAMSGDSKTAIAAYAQIHKVLSDGKLDITTNGRDITPEPITVEIIDSREQVERPDDEGM